MHVVESNMSADALAAILAPLVVGCGPYVGQRAPPGSSAEIAMNNNDLPSIVVATLRLHRFTICALALLCR